MTNINVVDPSVELLTESRPLERIEKAGRVCYRSLGSIREGSAKPFVEMLISKCHYTPLEHATVVVPLRLLQPYQYIIDAAAAAKGYPRTAVSVVYGDVGLLTCSARRYVELGLPLAVLEDPAVTVSDNHFTMVIVTDRGIANQLIRHRAEAYDDDGYPIGVKTAQADELSVVQESTRYVNYGKKPFSVVRPVPFDFAFNENSEEYHIWYSSCAAAYSSYCTLLEKGLKPQAARNVLPLSTATTIVMSGNISQWQHLLWLRLAPDADPQARLIAAKIWELLKPHIPAAEASVSCACSNFSRWADEINKVMVKQ